MDTKQNTESNRKQNRKTPVVSISPDPDIDKLVRKAKKFTRRTKTFVYEQCVLETLKGKTADEVRALFAEVVR